MVVYAEDAELGRVPHIRTPVRMSASEVAVRETAPKLGEHTDKILGALGYGSAVIDTLRRAHVV
jgi:crotonobetainyl-CoA:carnitine CoA-transferase CaiB-like acyl-CoA transferase